jgi:hypothetical protein
MDLAAAAAEAPGGLEGLVAEVPVVPDPETAGAAVTVKFETGDWWCFAVIVFSLQLLTKRGYQMMKKVLVLITVFMLAFSSLVYAGGDKNRGSKGQGSTGTNGGGATTQTRGK